MSGRIPASGAADETSVRQRLLKTATRLFAENGYDGTSVDAIVDATGVNKNMVYYYFGNKAKLYIEVFDDAYASLESLELFVLREHLPIEQLISELVRLYFELHRTHEALTRLVLQENLARGRHLIPKKIKNARVRVFELIKKALDEGKAKGTVKKEIDDKIFMIALIGACQIFASNRYTLSSALSIDLASQKVLKKAQSQVSDLLKSSIKA